MLYKYTASCRLSYTTAAAKVPSCAAHMQTRVMRQSDLLESLPQPMAVPAAAADPTPLAPLPQSTAPSAVASGGGRMHMALERYQASVFGSFEARTHRIESDPVAVTTAAVSWLGRAQWAIACPRGFLVRSWKQITGMLHKPVLMQG